MMQFIAYGEEQNYVQPPKPKDPKKHWDIDWSVKVRLKSTAMLPLMETAADDERQPATKPRRSDTNSDAVEEQTSEEQNPLKGVGDAMKGLLKW